MTLQKNSKKKSQKELQSKKVVIRFEEEAYKKFKQLEKSKLTKPSGKQLTKSINTAINKLSENPYCGDLIQRRKIPKKVTQKYGTDQLFRLELVGYWRLIYTLRGEELIIIALILEFLNHKKYDKLFEYNKK